MTRTRLDLTRPQILAFRRKAGGLDERLPRGRRSLRRAAWAGLQDSMPRAALLSLHARVDGTEQSTWEDPSLVQLWGPRFHIFVVAAADRAVFSLGTLPDDAKGRRRAEDLAAQLDALLGGEPMTCGEAGRARGGRRSGPCRRRRPALTMPAWNSPAGTCTSMAQPHRRPSAGGRESAGGPGSRLSRHSARR